MKHDTKTYTLPENEEPAMVGEPVAAYALPQQPPQTVPMDSTEALWTLIQSQTKAVKKALTARLVEWDFQTRLQAARKEIEKGECVTLCNKEEIDNYFDRL